jgi:hypothetical protein
MENMRAIAALKLEAGSITTTAASAELNLQKYFVSPGKREMKAVLVAIPRGAGTDSGTLDYKLQESATTVDSDFADITGAAFTQVTEATSAAPESIHFFTAKQFVRGYATVAGTTVYDSAALLLVSKRDA